MGRGGLSRQGFSALLGFCKASCFPGQSHAACTSERPSRGVPDTGSWRSWRLGRLEPPRTWVAEPAGRSTPAHWLSGRAALQSPSADLEFSGAGVLHAFVSLGRRRSRGVGLRVARPHPSFAYSRLRTEVVVVSEPLGAHTDTPQPPPRLQAPCASGELCREAKLSPARLRLSCPYCPGTEEERLPVSKSRAQ